MNVEEVQFEVLERQVGIEAICNIVTE